MQADRDPTTSESVSKKKKAEWFKHDTDASRDEKLLQLRAAGGWEYVGLWWALIELLSGQDDFALREKSFPGTAVFLSIPQDKFREFVAACLEAELLVKEEDRIFSNSLRERLSKFEVISRKRAQAGAKGAAAREQQEPPPSKPQANAEQLPSKCQAIDLSNLVLSNLLLDPSFSNGGGVRYIALDQIAAEQVYSNWLSAGLEKSDFIAGIRAYDAWKGKKAQMGERTFDDDARALLQPWVMTEAAKLKIELEKLKKSRGIVDPKKINWDRVFEGVQ